MSNIRFVGLDVHADAIAVAVAETGGEVRSLGVIPNRLESIRKLVHKLGPVQQLRACYEAGPTGYVLYWQLTQLGVACEVIAPSLIPTKAGGRVKTDRRDAEKLARCYRAGELTAVWVPDAAHEALRDLVRAREAAKKDQLKARHRLGKFLLRHGRRPEGLKAWTKRYLEWIKIHVHFDQPALEATLADYQEEVDHVAARILKLEKAIDEAVRAAPAEIRAVIEALQALRGVAQTTAATIVSELGSVSRFQSPRGFLLRRQKNLALSDEVKQMAWKAQQRLHKRYTAFAARDKNKNQIVTAIGRELLGFIWAIAVHTEQQQTIAITA
jgi:transposase